MKKKIKKKYFFSLKKVNVKKVNVKKVNVKKVSNILIEAKNLYGDLFKKTDKENFSFIYGIRKKYNIINIKILSLYLKRIFFLLKKIILKKKKILIIGNSFDVKILFYKKKKNNNIFFFNKKWINGLITNNDIRKKFLLNKNFSLIIIFKSSINDIFLLKELSYFKIPIISLLSTKQKINKITYPLLINNINFKSIYTIIFLLRKNFLKNE